MMLSYSCQLISLMTVRNIPHPVQTLRDLIDNPDLTVIYVPNTIITSVMAESQGELHEVHKLQNVGRTNFIGTGSLANAIEMLVGRGDHVIIGTTNPMKRLIARSFSLTGKCDFYISQQIIYSNIMSMVGQKGSSIVRAISKWLSLVTEAGLYSKWLDSALNNYTICRQSPSKITIKSSITMNNIWGIMAVPLLGILLATVSFCYEMASYSIDIKIN
ncbi:hypothetical protein Pmani_007435 [Petrolisthes manimaculis]|uniref:Uncharacterized protein n=1 Tax=Petrolisthes manimaculis TaxID=1843537 RepID=A0AAE1Q8Z2_9EUCA|nr:hypothetical protein Pmani_007435 [Petrolisthes manimaculis]